MHHYLKVRWLHEHPHEPVLLVSELDEDRYEIRKVEVYADGRMAYASEHAEAGDARLAELPVPEAFEIAADPEFIVEDITMAQFERFWDNATS